MPCVNTILTLICVCWNNRSITTASESMEYLLLDIRNVFLKWKPYQIKLFRKHSPFAKRLHQTYMHNCMDFRYQKISQYMNFAELGSVYLLVLRITCLIRNNLELKHLNIPPILSCLSLVTKYYAQNLRSIVYRWNVMNIV